MLPNNGLALSQPLWRYLNGLAGVDALEEESINPFDGLSLLVFPNETPYILAHGAVRTGRKSLFDVLV